MQTNRVLVLMCMFSLAATARASPPENNRSDSIKVVIDGMTRCCTANAWPEAESSVKAELASLDVAVEIRDGDMALEADRHAGLAAIAAQAKASCAIRIMTVRMAGHRRSCC